MEDRELKTTLKNHMQDLAGVLVLYKKLRDTLSEDRQTWTAVGGDMAQLVQAFETQINHLTTLQDKIQVQVIEVLTEQSIKAAHVVSQQMRQRVSDILDREVQEAVRHLEHMTLRVSQRMERAEETVVQGKWWVCGLAIIIAIASGLIGSAVVRKSFPTQTFTHEQHQWMKSGQVLEAAWGGLNKNDRDKILALARGELVQPQTFSKPVISKKK